MKHGGQPAAMGLPDPSPGVVGPEQPDDPSRHLNDLLDAAFSHEGLRDVVAAVAHWWRQRLPGRRLAIGVVDEARRRLIADGSFPDVPPESATPDHCIVAGPMSVRDDLLRLLGAPDEHEWFPLGDHGRVIGGIVVESPPTEAIPALWIDVTARLLAHALDRDQRLLSAKLASLAEFAAGAGHEINNPLGTIVGRAQQLARDERDPERRRTLRTIGAQALRIRDMIGDTMLFARPPAPQLSSVDLGEQIDTVLSRFDDEVRRKHVRIEGSRPRGIMVSADPTQLAVVLSELLRNALQAVSEGGTVELSAASLSVSDPSVAELIVRDNGPGLSPSEREHLFDPFYSGRQAGRSLGFGLSKCWRIVTQHGGCLHAESSLTGAMFIVHLPCAINTSTPL